MAQEPENCAINRDSFWRGGGVSLYTVPRLLFADEPFKMYEGFEIDIRMIRAVAVDHGSAKKTIPDVSKTFSFGGDGTATEVYR